MAVHSVLFWVHVQLMITNAKRLYWLVPQAAENSSRVLSQRKQTKTDNKKISGFTTIPLY